MPITSPPQLLRIMIVDDHPLMRAGIGAILNSQPGMSVVAQAGSIAEARSLFAHHRPDITLMDLRLPDGSGAELIRTLRSRTPQARFIVVTTYDGDEDIHQALEAGAQGYIIKGMPHEALVAAIRAVGGGRRYLPSPVTRAMESRTPESTLSAREREVLALIVAGRSNRQISEDLFISEATVKTHLRAIFTRMGVTDRTQAAVTAIQRGLIKL